MHREGLVTQTLFATWGTIDRGRVYHSYRLQVYKVGHVVNKYNRSERLLPLARDKHDYHSRRGWGAWKKARNKQTQNRRKEGGEEDLGREGCAINECGKDEERGYKPDTQE